MATPHRTHPRPPRGLANHHPRPPTCFNALISEQICRTSSEASRLTKQDSTPNQCRTYPTARHLASTCSSVLRNANGVMTTYLHTLSFVGHPQQRHLQDLYYPKTHQSLEHLFGLHIPQIPNLGLYNKSTFRISIRARACTRCIFLRLNDVFGHYRRPLNTVDNNLPARW